MIVPSVSIFASSSARDGQNHGQPATIVADAGAFQNRAFAFDAHVRAFGKHCVQMRGQRQHRPIAFAWAFAQHVADFINANVFQSQLGEALFEPRAATLFLKGGRGNFANGDLFLNRSRFSGFQVFQRLFDVGQIENPFDGGFGGLRLGKQRTTNDEHRGEARTANQQFHLVECPLSCNAA